MDRERRGGKAPIPPWENSGLTIGLDRHGKALELPRVFEVFKQYQNNPGHQANLARGCILRNQREGNADPDDIIALIPAEAVREEIKVWCKGRGIQLREDEADEPESRYRRAKAFLAADEDLIEKLSPHLRQIDLARILVLKKYRNADEETQQSLVSGTYRLLGDVLGPRRYYRQDAQVITPINLPDLPIEIFGDELIRNVLLESEKEAALPIFQKSVETGFKYLEERKKSLTEPLLVNFVEDLERHYQEGLASTEPGFKSKVAGSQKDIPDVSEITYSDFPAPHQKLYGYRLKHKAIGPVDLLIGDVRTGKTKAAIYGLVAAGAKAPVIVCPASLRDNWEREILETCEEPVEIIKVETERQFRSLTQRVLPRAEGAKRFTILSYSLLSRLSTVESLQLFTNFVHNLGLDGLDADEVHLAKEANAECTKQLYLLSRALPKEAPRIAMTATGVVNSVEDLDAPVRILLPYQYEKPGDFTRSARNDPQLVSALLYGKQLMTRWTAEAIWGDKLPSVEHRVKPIPLSPFHKSVYEFVYFDDTIEAQVKRGMLRQVSLDPLLIRGHYNPRAVNTLIDGLRQKQIQEQDEKKKEIIGERIKAFEQRIGAVTNLSNFESAMKDLSDAYDKFIRWQVMQKEDTVFDEDFLVRMGYEKLALWAFFNLAGGVDELVRQAQDRFLQKDWTGKQGLYSSKYRALKEDLDELLSSGKAKVAIFSGFYVTNVTSGIEDISDGDELAFFSLYDHLRTWYGEDTILKIDGSVTMEPRAGELADRERIRRSWRLIPAKRIGLFSNRSSRLGIDLTIPPTKENEVFEKVIVINLDNPDTAADKIQGIGRFRGPGQKIPLEVIDYQATNAEQPHNVRYGFIDHGMWQALEFKRLLAQMTLDCVPLTKDEEAFVKENLTNLRIELYPTTPQVYLTQRFFVDIRGKGTKKNLEYLAKQGFEGLTNAEFFITYYAQNDEMSLAGHNAKAIAEIMKRERGSSYGENYLIGSIGSGAGILQSVLGEPIVNIDMFFDILSFARRRLRGQGSFVTADGANLPITSEVFNDFDASMVIHWTSNDPIRTNDHRTTSERAKFLEELNRVTKTNGRVRLTVPWSYLTATQFRRWMNCFSDYFGFRPCENVPSGLLRATDYRAEPISWIFNLEKIGEPQLGLTLGDLRFDFEDIVHIVSSGNGHGGNGGIRIPQPVPHSEFEIVQPDGKTEGFVYNAPPPERVNLQDLEEEILGKKEKTPLSGEDIITFFGIEEYGFYRRLRRIAKNRWDLEAKDADQVALKTITQWVKSDPQRHDTGRILTELDIIMEEILERRNKK